MTPPLVTLGHRPHPLVTFFLTLLFALLTAASASADPAGRVGRLSWLSGSVTLQSPDNDDSTAMLNWPLTSGHRLVTGPDGRAEVQIGSTMLQLASRSVVDFVQIDDERVRLHLLDGSLTARLYAPEAVHEFEIVTREGSFQPLTAGFFRIDVDHSSSAATSYSGRLRFMAFDQTVTVDTGQRAQLWHDGRTQHRFLLPDNDEFARWAAVRDQQYGSPLQARYVSAEMTGASHLDAFGRWYDSPEYGAVWFPQTIAADWTPYRDGRWAWVSPWGWTWIGIEPWGFAPFHYGRWVFYRNAWGWVPGQRVHRPIFAPALVAWTSTPGNIAAPIGWFPLAPREIYRPDYRSSEHYLRALNGPHAPRNFNYRAFLANPSAAASVRYEYHGHQRAMTMVPANTFAQRRPVTESIIAERDRRTWIGQPVQIQAPVAAPNFVRRDGERRELERRQEAERRTAEERRQEIDRRRIVERSQVQSDRRPLENNTIPSAGGNRELRQERAPENATRHSGERSSREQASPAMPPGLSQPAAAGGTTPATPVRSAIDSTLPNTVRPAPAPRIEPVRPPVAGGSIERTQPDTGRPAPLSRPETVRQPANNIAVDRPSPEAGRSAPVPRAERVETRPAAVAPATLPVPQRPERPPVEVRAAERMERRDIPHGRPETGHERVQPSRPVPAAPPMSTPTPVERSVRQETEARGGRDRRDERRGPGFGDRP